MTTSVGLEWLRPELDRCRALIADHKSPRRWTKTEQGRSELVTEVDLAIERLLIDAIRQRLPDAAILSEESNADPSALEQDTCFVIDPIDGTEEFAAGRQGFGISIALFERGRPTAAVLDMPAHDWRFECAVGAGASLNGKGIRLSPVGALAEARLAVSATQYGMDSLRPFWDGVGAAGLIPTPAFTPKFAAVLAGECDAALYLPIRPHRTAIWDYAAAAQLLSEAGGWFGATDGTDLLEALPFEYSGGWVAAPPSLRDQLLAVAQRSPRWTICAGALIRCPAVAGPRRHAGRAPTSAPRSETPGTRPAAAKRAFLIPGISLSRSRGASCERAKSPHPWKEQRRGSCAPTCRPLLIFVQLSSQGTVEPVRQDGCFAEKQEPHPALVLILSGTSV